MSILNATHNSQAADDSVAVIELKTVFAEQQSLCCRSSPQSGGAPRAYREDHRHAGEQPRTYSPSVDVRLR